MEQYRRILVLNSGSSSIKYKLFDMSTGQVISKGMIERIGEVGSEILTHRSGLEQILAGVGMVDAVGHRVVHGGEEFSHPTIVDDEVIAGIRRCSAFAPLHNPANLEGILACRELLPQVPQVAVFDTAFHKTIPRPAHLYALPYDLYEKHGIRRYGFHGTSHQYVAEQAAKLLERPLEELKLITAHLGNGCSIAAIDGGVSVDTSLGFTPLAGLIMGTRCGDIDAALVTHIMRLKGIDIEQVERLLNRESGLLGISGISNDMRDLSARAEAGDEQCQLAIDMFIYSIKKYIGAYIAVLGGCDAIVFTGGIGENMESVRTGACEGLEMFLKYPPKILVIPTDEEGAIAGHAYRTLGQ